MRKLTRKLSLNELYADSKKGCEGWAAVFGKPVIDIWPEKKEKKVRVKSEIPTLGAKEADVLASVLAFLKLHPAVGWVHRMNVGATESADGRYVKFGFTGCSDILGQMKDGRMLAIEVKREIGGKASEAQLAFIYTVQKYHGIAGVVRSIDDASKLLREE